MNKSALKKFATEARRELLERIELQARKLGITAGSIQKANVESSDAIFIDGRQLSDIERKQRNKLIARINEIGFNRVIEETAYTWFNRFIALRFMEVNDYLPTKVRVLSSTNPNSTEPDMMKEALSLDLPIDKEYVYNLKMKNKTDELFKYLIKMHCNDLNRYMPFMFETIEDYKEILFPEGMLGTDSFVRTMTNMEVISEEDWGKVEIIGWLYQYYITEEKDRVIQAKKKYKTEEIPFATQLFTPDWIVQYMVQNSLGRYWVESHPEHRDLLVNWEFYLENSNPEPDFEEKLAPYINKELKIEDIKCFDPAMGSGHILVYMFDVLYEIYSKCGYMEREIPKLIIENNLFGLDIDDRAYQLACFSVVMKAVEYNSRFFRSIEREGLKLNLTSIQETNMFNNEDIAYFAGDNNEAFFEKTKDFIEYFKDAKTIGALLKITDIEIISFKERLKYIEENPAKDFFEEEPRRKVLSLFPKILKQYEIMLNQYDILVTNPPYMGNQYMKSELHNYLNTYYGDYKADLFASFINYSIQKTKKNGHIGMLTPFVWMFLPRYQKLREYIMESNILSSLIQLEYNSFESATVPVCTFTFRNYYSDLSGEYIKLSDFKGIQQQEIRVKEAVENPDVNYRYTCKYDLFKNIQGYPIAYWISPHTSRIFKNYPSFGEIASIKSGMSTSDNNRFLRNWWEVSYDKIGFGINNSQELMELSKKWVPYNKGGEFKMWYGNQESVVNWENDGEEIKNYASNLYVSYTRTIKNIQHYFKEGLTWSRISNANFGVRYLPKGFIFDTNGSMVFPEKKYQFYYLALLCSKIANYFIRIINPTMAIQAGSVALIPVVKIKDETLEKIDSLVEKLVNNSKNDWDSFEVSWEFQTSPLLKNRGESLTIEDAFRNWHTYTNSKFNEQIKNEEEINQIFIEIYGLKNELDFHVDKEHITIQIAEAEKEIKSFISFAVGCMFGRYSLDEEGLIFAGGEFNSERYLTFNTDKDNILSILPGTYFEDDIVSRFIDFVRVTFSEKTLVENLDFVADALGRKKNETARETLRRYFLNDFFKDHVKTYKKHPIYWLFTSGKEKAFNCLIYMHRYDKTTLSRIRTDYLHEVQIRMDAEKKDLLTIIEGDSTAKEISAAKKELKSIDKKIDELKAYDELLHHMADQQIEIDLDDGVKHNYELFKGLVAKI